MDSNGDGVDEFEFVVATLIAFNKISKEDLDPIIKKFHELDADGSGLLTYEDLVEWRSPKAGDEEQ